MTDIRVFYPGFLTKAVTFSMDDGRVEQDAKLLEIMRPGGFLGTFNLPRVDLLTPAEYRELYRGYEIANHCKNHPYTFDDDVEYKISKDVFDAETSDGAYIYEHPGKPRFYYFKRSVGWRLMTDPDTYIECVRACHAELESVFGEGSVRGYAWPFYEQNSRKVREYLCGCGYTNIRGSGLSGQSTAFDLPYDPMRWRCNANHTNLLDTMTLYEAYPDDGRLKLFAFGVHASDYEKPGRWEELLAFAEKYGNRHDDFWYATVGDVFNYKRCAEKIICTEERIANPTDTELYVSYRGEKLILPAGSDVSF